ncbi:MAG: SAM-dependent methyltransferase, partial [Gammaproteobacteria bacterium]|nr:SAM-dependent methyltransferase [Gammaproteobacteria bacterium]
MNLRLLEKFIQQGRLTVIGHDGREQTFGEGEPSATWRLNGPSTFMRILRNPQLNLGETYMDGEWGVGEGTLHDLLTILRINLEPKVSGRSWLDPLRAVLRSWNGLAASRRNVSHHYDLD